MRRETISHFLGFSDEEIRQIASEEKVVIAPGINIIEELRNQHKHIIAA